MNVIATAALAVCGLLTILGFGAFGVQSLAERERRLPGSRSPWQRLASSSWPWRWSCRIPSN